MSVFSLISIFISLGGVYVYYLLLGFGYELYPFFVLVSIVSVVFPCISKKLRVKNNKKGKVLEIIALVIGGFNFYCMFFVIPETPIFLGYLGWIVFGLLYKYIEIEKDKTDGIKDTTNNLLTKGNCEMCGIESKELRYAKIAHSGETLSLKVCQDCFVKYDINSNEKQLDSFKDKKTFEE